LTLCQIGVALEICATLADTTAESESSVKGGNHINNVAIQNSGDRLPEYHLFIRECHLNPRRNEPTTADLQAVPAPGRRVPLLHFNERRRF
jgi:hypothetical protein